jgi:catechol 2,3-dioxygenase-like lactoylglutathione lyase family enzyme
MIIVEDVLYARFRVPELDRMESFLRDFGLTGAERVGDTLYMRSPTTGAIVHVTEAGGRANVGFAVAAQSREDLETLADEVGTRVEPRTEPDGGNVVRLVDPGGLHIEVVHGMAPSTPAATPAPQRVADRRNKPIRLAPRPSQVMRLGHVALLTPKLQESIDFYTKQLGMRISDAYHAGSKDNLMGVFLRCGLGERFTDHHTVALIGAPVGAFEHVAYEVPGIDDLMMGNSHLLRGGYQHSWGVGRHVQGSQIFDYWRDPFGNKIEHWTDGDLVNDHYETTSVEFSPDGLAQWAPPLSEDFLG